MRFMVMVKATATSEAGTIPSPEDFAAMGAYNEELVRAGVLLAADGLKPSSAGARVRFSGSDRTVLDGPFAATSELVAGYWILQAASMAEVLDWVKRCPNPMPGEDSEIEIRPIYSDDDFGENATPELREADARMRATVAEQHPDR